MCAACAQRDSGNNSSPAQYDDVALAGLPACVQAARGELEVALVVKDKKQLAKINYAHQGDATFYSSDMLKVWLSGHVHAAHA